MYMKVQQVKDLLGPVSTFSISFLYLLLFNHRDLVCRRAFAQEGFQSITD